MAGGTDTGFAYVKLKMEIRPCESSLPRNLGLVNSIKILKGKDKSIDNNATLSARIEAALEYSALQVDYRDGIIYHRELIPVNGTYEMIFKKWDGRTIKPIDKGKLCNGEPSKDYIKGLGLAADYLNVTMENVGKLVKNFWLRPSHVIINSDKVRRQEQNNNSKSKKKKRSKQIILKPNGGRVYFFNLEELNEVRKRLDKRQRLYSRTRVTEKQLRRLDKAVKKEQRDMQKYYDGLRT